MSIWIDKQGRRHVGIMVRGKRIHRICDEGATASDAKQLEADLRRELSATAPTPSLNGDPSITSLLPAYEAHAQTLRWPEPALLCIRRITPWLVGKLASEADTAAAAIVSDMRGQYAPATINRSLAALKKALSLAYRAKLTARNFGDLVEFLPTNNKREMYLTIEQVRQLADHCPEPARAAVWIALLTGARRGEILKLRPEDIGRNTITIHAGNTKTLRSRTVPVVPALRPWLKHVPIAYTTYEGLKTAFQRARIAAEMPWVNFHDLRHSCASILLASGADLYTISQVLGHATTTTTQRYAHMQVEQQRTALARAFAKAPRQRA